MDREQLNALPVFDEQGIASIKNLLGDEFDTIVDDFIVSTPPLISALSAAIDQYDIDEIINISHRLKSGGGNLGLTAFFAICEHLELSMRNGIDLQLTEVLEKIREQFERIMRH